MPGSRLQDPSHHDSNAGSGQGERGVEDSTPCRIPSCPLEKVGGRAGGGRKGREGRRLNKEKAKRRKISAAAVAGHDSGGCSEEGEKTRENLRH